MVAGLREDAWAEVRSWVALRVDASPFVAAGGGAGMAVVRVSFCVEGSAVEAMVSSLLSGIQVL